MKLEELHKLVQNALAYPYAWEKFGLGDLPVEKVAAFVRDRAAHIAQEIAMLQEEPADGECPTCGAASVVLCLIHGHERPRAGEVVGVDDDGPISVEYVSRYPRTPR